MCLIQHWLSGLYRRNNNNTQTESKLLGNTNKTFFFSLSIYIITVFSSPNIIFCNYSRINWVISLLNENYEISFLHFNIIFFFMAGAVISSRKHGLEFHICIRRTNAFNAHNSIADQGRGSWTIIIHGSSGLNVKRSLYLRHWWRYNLGVSSRFCP